MPTCQDLGNWNRDRVRQDEPQTNLLTLSFPADKLSGKSRPCQAPQRISPLVFRKGTYSSKTHQRRPSSRVHFFLIRGHRENSSRPNGGGDLERTRPSSRQVFHGRLAGPSGICPHGLLGILGRALRQLAIANRAKIRCGTLGHRSVPHMLRNGAHGFWHEASNEQ